MTHRTPREGRREMKCEDCLAHFPEGHYHVCPPWLKALVAMKRKRDAKDISSSAEGRDSENK